MTTLVNQQAFDKISKTLDWGTVNTNTVNKIPTRVISIYEEQVM